MGLCHITPWPAQAPLRRFELKKLGSKYKQSTKNMNHSSYEAASKIISKTYVQQGEDAKKTHEKCIQILMQQVSKVIW